MTRPIIIGEEFSAPAIIWANAMGLNVKWLGCTHGRLFDQAGKVIGSFHEYVNAPGYSIHTKAYGGYAHRHEMEFTTCSCDEEAA